MVTGTYGVLERNEEGHGGRFSKKNRNDSDKYVFKEGGVQSAVLNWRKYTQVNYIICRRLETTSWYQGKCS